MTDWAKLQEENTPKYKQYAEPGKHTVKVSGINIHEISTGSVAQDFTFEEDEYKYPKATHWLSFNNANWRKWHNRCLMMVLGASKENAEKAVDICEDKGDKEKIIKAYQDTYERLIKKAPEVEIEVWPDGKYSKADFTDNTVRMNRPEEQQKKDEIDDILDEPEEASDISEDDLPFN